MFASSGPLLPQSSVVVMDTSISEWLFITLDMLNMCSTQDFLLKVTFLKEQEQDTSNPAAFCFEAPPTTETPDYKGSPVFTK